MAYHEAGHAVVAHHLGMRVGAISAFSADDGEQGYCRIGAPLDAWLGDSPPARPIPLPHLRHQVTMLVAGRVAVRLAGITHPPSSAFNDMQEAYYLLAASPQAVDELDWPRFVARRRLSARCLLRRSWPAVEQVVVTLLTGAVMDTSDLWALLGTPLTRRRGDPR